MKKLLTPILTAGGLLALASAFAPANALLEFSANIGGNVFSCQDGNISCDTDLTVNGVITTSSQSFINGTGTITFLGSAQTQTTGASNTLTTTSFQITNTGPAIGATIAVGGIDFVGPVTAISNSGSGTWTNAGGSQITLQFYADTANDQGGEAPTDHPGALIADSGVLNAVGATDSINYNSGFVPFVDPDLFSMTLFTTGTIVAGTTATPSQLTGRSQTMVAINEVPEPASLAILGGALAGFGALMHRRRRRAAA